MELKVSEALTDDVGFSLARIGRAVMERLDVKEGDFVLIKGEGEALAKVQEGDVDAVRIDSKARKSVNRGISETVDVFKIELPEAKEVRLTPARQGISLTMEPELLLKGLEGKPVMKGSLIEHKQQQEPNSFLIAKAISQAPAGFDFDMTLQVQDVKPEKGVITKNTRIIRMPKT